MKLIHRITLFAFASAILTVALSGAAHAQAPIKIGASLSTTGSFAALGQNQLRGYQLCIKRANEKGGVLGCRLELIPGLDGWEATRRLKNQPETKHIPIIVLSSHDREKNRDKAPAAGSDGFETKPTDFEQLVGKIRSLLSRSAKP